MFKTCVAVIKEVNTIWGVRQGYTSGYERGITPKQYNFHKQYTKWHLKTSPNALSCYKNFNTKNLFRNK